MGVPVISLVGPTGVSRAGWSQLSNLGLTELAAQNESDLVRVATTLAKDLPRLAALRAGLRERMQRSPLMDAPRFCRGIENAYRTLCKMVRARGPSVSVPGGPGTVPVNLFRGRARFRQQINQEPTRISLEFAAKL
ncbi:MAG: hypothetical protein EXS38_06655 [Opitutus sp.]|nr:hypothetical protein [Opitutus sp.]